MALNVSAKVHYACLAMSELAKQHQNPKPIQVRKLAAAHKIPAQFLVQILQQLKTARLVNSTRGASGGYRLSRDPTDISFGDVVRAMESSSDDGIESTRNPTGLALQQMFQDLKTTVWDQLDNTSLQHIVEQIPTAIEPMYYI